MPAFLFNRAHGRDLPSFPTRRSSDLRKNPAVHVRGGKLRQRVARMSAPQHRGHRSEEHTPELQSHRHLVCRLFFSTAHTGEIYPLSLPAALPISGRTRQFTFAAASCGSALRACPPSSIVATQVVRSMEFQTGELPATRSIAAGSPLAAAASVSFSLVRSSFACPPK